MIGREVLELQHRAQPAVGHGGDKLQCKAKQGSEAQAHSDDLFLRVMKLEVVGAALRSASSGPWQRQLQCKAKQGSEAQVHSDNLFLRVMK